MNTNLKITVKIGVIKMNEFKDTDYYVSVDTKRNNDYLIHNKSYKVCHTENPNVYYGLLISDVKDSVNVDMASLSYVFRNSASY